MTLIFLHKWFRKCDKPVTWLVPPRLVMHGLNALPSFHGQSLYLYNAVLTELRAIKHEINRRLILLTCSIYGTVDSASGYHTMSKLNWHSTMCLTFKVQICLMLTPLFEVPKHNTIKLFVCLHYGCQFMKFNKKWELTKNKV